MSKEETARPSLAAQGEPAAITVSFSTHLRPDGDIVRATIKQGDVELEITKEQAQSLAQQLTARIEP